MTSFADRQQLNSHSARLSTMLMTIEVTIETGDNQELAHFSPP